MPSTSSLGVPLDATVLLIAHTYSKPFLVTDFPATLTPLSFGWMAKLKETVTFFAFFAGVE